MSDEWKSGSYVGKHLTTTEYAVTPELVQDYIARTLDTNPWYVSDSPFGGPVAPATLLFAHAHLHNDDWYLPIRYGNLHTKQEWWFYQPAMVGDTILATRTISDRYSKRGRDYVVCDVTILDRDGVLLARSRSHQSFLQDAAAKGVIVDRAREQRPDRKFDPGAGEVVERFGPVSRLVDQALSDRFVGEGGRNYHNDAAEAEKLGFPEIVVQGTLPICFLNELMSNQFGAGWWRGGRMSVNLVNVIWLNEDVHARGVIREWRNEGERRRADCEIWTEKSDGAVTIIGTASAPSG
ncbi:MAG: MaoC family dehydratase N-terminal domain-containing protein [Dehalococcoidia bacterium]